MKDAHELVESIHWQAVWHQKVEDFKTEDFCKKMMVFALQVAKKEDYIQAFNELKNFIKENFKYTFLLREYSWKMIETWGRCTASELIAGLVFNEYKKRSLRMIKEFGFSESLSNELKKSVYSNRISGDFERRLARENTRMNLSRDNELMKFVRVLMNVNDVFCDVYGI